MKDKNLIIKVDDEFLEKVEYIERINDYKNRSDTVRKVVEKEYRKEVFPCGTCKCYEEKKCIILNAGVNPRERYGRWPLGKEKEDGQRNDS